MFQFILGIFVAASVIVSFILRTAVMLPVIFVGFPVALLGGYDWYLLRVIEPVDDFVSRHFDFD